MIDAATLRAAGTSPAAIAHHYDLPADFFELWLGPDHIYSCALWNPQDPEDRLDVAQRRKLDFFGTALGVRDKLVLDIGCGWGALLDRFVTAHGTRGGVGLTLSEAQGALAMQRRVPGVHYKVESWVDHHPSSPYDAITCIEATEHLASDSLDADDKVAVYRAFFERCADWLKEGGRLGLQLICLDNVGHTGSRAGRGAASELIRVDIFPESMPASLSELVLGWETHFELEHFVEHHDHYRRTFRAWGMAFRSAEARARALVGDATVRTFARYFAAGEVFFRMREDALYRVILRKRHKPKRWTRLLQPSDLPHEPRPDMEVFHSTSVNRGASVAAVQAHYDLSNDFYALWLGPTMMYTSGLWAREDDAWPDLDAAVTRKIDFFASRVAPSANAHVLDVGCGWGGALRRMAATGHMSGGVGLTLSAAQCDFVDAHPMPSAGVRLESWTDHQPKRPYDAIVSYGAFEHFAKDGSTSIDRIETYRRFFARCFAWLAVDGRVGLETIGFDSAPDTASPLGRGPLGDSVLELYPESLCPHLCEIVLGFEPYFEVELLQADAGDFARTCRLWHLALRAREADATRLVGAETVRRFRQYLVSSEVQFRTRTITNYRCVLHRRPSPRW